MTTIKMEDVGLDETLETSTEPTWIPKELDKVELDPTEFVEEAIHTEDNKGTILYRERWLMLFLFSFVSFCNSLLFASFPPISLLAAEFYRVDVVVINFLSLLYFIVYVPFCFVAAWMLDTKGLKITVAWGAALQTLGAWIRVSLSFSQAAGLYPIYLGHFICAIAGVFIVGATPSLAASWFGPNERTLATAVGFTLNSLGTSIGFLMSPALVSEGEDIFLMLLVHGAITTFFSAIFLIWFSDKPPTPPSASAAAPRSANYAKIFQSVSKDFHFILVWFAFGVLSGSYYAVLVLIEQLGYSAGYTEGEAGVFGFISLIGAVIGALGASIADRYPNKYKLLMCLSAIGSALSFVFFSFSIHLANDGIAVSFSLFLMGLFVNFCMQVLIQVAIEICFPISEGVSANMQVMALQLMAVIFIMVMSFLEDPETHSTTVSTWVVTVCVCIVSVSLLFFKGEYKRYKIDIGMQNVYNNVE